MTEKENLVLTMALVLQAKKALEQAQENIIQGTEKLEEQTNGYKETKILLENSLNNIKFMFHNINDNEDSFIGDEMCFFCKYYTKMFTYGEGVCDFHKGEFWHKSVKGTFKCKNFKK